MQRGTGGGGCHLAVQGRAERGAWGGFTLTISNNPKIDPAIRLSTVVLVQNIHCSITVAPTTP